MLQLSSLITCSVFLPSLHIIFFALITHSCFLILLQVPFFGFYCMFDIQECDSVAQRIFYQIFFAFLLSVD